MSLGRARLERPLPFWTATNFAKLQFWTTTTFAKLNSHH
jgi:hypothetical protein